VKSFITLPRLGTGRTWTGAHAVVVEAGVHRKWPALQVNVGGALAEVNSRFFSAGLNDPLTRVHGMQNASTMGDRLVQHFAAVPLQ
jgi:hypothetical protein